MERAYHVIVNGKKYIWRKLLNSSAKKDYPKGFKLALAVVFLYLISLCICVILNFEIIGIATAFMAIVTTVAIELVKNLEKDSIAKTIILLFSTPIGIICVGLYILAEDRLPIFLGRANIGNVLTILSLVVVYISYLFDLYVSRKNRKH